MKSVRTNCGLTYNDRSNKLFSQIKNNISEIARVVYIRNHRTDILVELMLIDARFEAAIWKSLKYPEDIIFWNITRKEMKRRTFLRWFREEIGAGKEYMESRK